MKTVLLIGPLTRRAGYGEQARFALRSLRAHGDRFNILIQDIPWGQTGQISEDNEEQRYIMETIKKTHQHLHHKLPIDISLQVTIPNEFKKYAPVNIGYTAGIETTRVSPQWIEQSWLMDKIILVSNHSKDVYEKTSYEGTNSETGEKAIIKTEVPMEVVNYPVRSLEADDLELELRHDFNFLTISQMGPRKNLANTIKWFLEEFHDDEVGLVVKTNMMNCSTNDGQYCMGVMKEMVKHFPDRKCSVHLLHGDLSLKQMNSLYTHPKMKGFVTLTHGEGFGLPIFEAAYHGLPVIAPAWSGQNDFLYAPVKSGKQKKAKLRPLFAKVDYTIGQVPPEAVWEGVIQADSSWCYPTEGGSKSAMRDVYSNYSNYVGMARKLKKHILKNFTEEKMTTKFANAVCEEEESVDVQGWVNELLDTLK
jgi:glycosyltransferase involved in cell wall biosynthesis